MNAEVDSLTAADLSSATFAEDRLAKEYVWYVVALLTIVNVLNYVDRMALSVLLPLIKRDLGLSDAQVGVLAGFAFALFYAICGVPIARYADRGIRRNIIAIALAVWSIMTAAAGAAQNFWHLFAARVGVGVGEAGGLAPAQSVLCDYVPLKRRAGVFAVHSSGLIIGMMIGMVLAGWLGETLGWRWTFFALGLPGIVVAAVVRLSLREPARGRLDPASGASSDSSWRRTIAFLWKCRTYRILILYFVAHGFTYGGLTQWWPSFYTRTFQLSLSSTGMYLGIALGIGSLGGMLMGGLLSNKYAQRDLRLPLLISAVAMFLAIPAAASSLLVASLPISIGLVLVTGVLWSVCSGPVNATLYSIVVAEMRATAGAITIVATAIFGFGLGPLVVGLLSDYLAAHGRETLRYALLVPVCLMPLTAVALYAASTAVRADLKRVGFDRLVA